MTNKRKNFILGIDTGGTYTDAVVIDGESHGILSSAKAITTKGDLAIGVGEAMAAAVARLGGTVKPQDIGLVSVSTTLATNAVVEGHGSSAGVVLIGFDGPMIAKTGIARAFPGMPLAAVAGGHDHNGDALQPLDEAALRGAITVMQEQVSAFAIAAAFAVRNNTHELRAREIIAAVTAKPVTLSSELSSSLDAPRRALTAVLNARLIGRISQLIAAVRSAKAALGIEAPLMIVKGDGSLASADSVAARPIETVLSGPAASLVGARWLSRLDDFIMSDMGGTTTDVGVLVNGRPLVAAQGAEVGGWRTMVKAIDVRTVGLGGDSEVKLDAAGKLVIGPQRAVPVALLAARYPELVAMLESDLTESEGGSVLGKFLVRPFGQVAAPSLTGLSDRETAILGQVGERPIALRKLVLTSATQRAIAALRRKGLVQYCAFTPSDAACVLGLQDNWPAPAAELAARLLARFRDMRMPDHARVKELCTEVWSTTVSLSARVILETAIGPDGGSGKLVDAVCDGRPRLNLANITIAPAVPIVAVGGPVKVYYGEVGRRLSCEVVFAPYFDVANAVGAAAGLVADRVTVTVDGDGNGAFRIHGAGATQVLGSGSLALRTAIGLAETAALKAAKDKGAKAPKTVVTIEKSLLPEACDDEGLLTATVTAEAIGQAA